MDIEETITHLKNGKKMTICTLIRTFKKEGIENFVVTRKKYVETVLSELEKIVSKKQYEKTKKTLKGIINKQNKEIKKKDKIIDEMVKYIANLDIDEDICKNIRCTNEGNEIQKNCSECVKQYFTKKVEGK